jgi:hypothetical protein
VSYGVYNDSSGPIMTNVTATGNGIIDSYGMYSLNSSPTARDSMISGGA